MKQHSSAVIVPECQPNCAILVLALLLPSFLAAPLTAGEPPPILDQLGLREPALWAGEAPQFAPLDLPTGESRAPSLPDKLTEEQRRRLRQIALLRHLLGQRRHRDYRNASFDCDLWQRHPSHPSDFSRDEREHLESEIRSGVLRISRELLESRLPFLDRTRERARHAIRSKMKSERASVVDIAPRLDVGSSSSLGARLRLRAKPQSLLSHLSLQSVYHFSDDATTLKLRYEDGRRSIHLQQTFNDREQGDVTSLWVRVGW